MNKKAQGLTLNTIIIATLALIVLVVLILIFMGKINIFNLGAETCVGTCHKVAECKKDTKIYAIGYKMSPCKETPESAGDATKPYCCPPPPTSS